MSEPEPRDLLPQKSVKQNQTGRRPPWICAEPLSLLQPVAGTLQLPRLRKIRAPQKLPELSKARRGTDEQGLGSGSELVSHCLGPNKKKCVTKCNVYNPLACSNECCQDSTSAPWLLAVQVSTNADTCPDACPPCSNSPCLPPRAPHSTRLRIKPNSSVHISSPSVKHAQLITLLQPPVQTDGLTWPNQDTIQPTISLQTFLHLSSRHRPPPFHLLTFHHTPSAIAQK